ncbi:hypothetical protein B0T22DRAFT_213844 [Podospora appendiculata]|uniref:Mid2 domain-containing protein n=1 Tax=Podospora appendiculata TaxID=314037 RepID=A0AAE1CA94_9PEZI|nr:hypothetical protein B0T22DRAFT_213844 [Podospora appendiculata]
MRSSALLLVASSCLASARWVKWTSGQDQFGTTAWQPKETRPSKVDPATGFTPKPTQAPGSTSDAKAVLDLLRRKDGARKRQDTGTWLNLETCGYYSGTSSSAWTCETNYHCATDSNNVVACISGTDQPFYTVCLDYQAYLKGACGSDIGSKTGCCTSSEYGACGTFLWPGQPPKSMYWCFASARIVNMLDEPQYVLDASTSSTTSTSSSSSTSSTTSATTAPADNSNNNNSNNSSSSSNIGAIVGGVVGGVAGVALIFGIIAYFIIRSKNKPVAATQTYSAVAPNDPANPAAPQSYAYPQQTSPQMMQSAGAYPAMLKDPSGVTVVQQQPYDPTRMSYYDPAKPQGLSPASQYDAYAAPYVAAGQPVPVPTAVAPPPPHNPHHSMPVPAPALAPVATPAAAPYTQHHAVMSELDSRNFATGLSENPAEMGINSPK